MFLPSLREVERSSSVVNTFGGIDLGERVAEGSWAWTENLSSREYPALTNREKRGIFRTLVNPGGMIGKEKLFWIEDGYIWYDGGRYDAVTPGEKQLVSMGAYVLIFPDKVAFNTDTYLTTRLENTTAPAGTVTVSLAKEDGSLYTDYATGETAPEEPENGDYWFHDGVMQVYSSQAESWTPVSTVYGLIQGTGIGIGFKAYDGVTISGCACDQMNGSKLLQAVTDNSLLVIGLVERETTQTGGIMVSRTVPDMDFVTALDNRCWGCSSYHHEIYACKLGDPTNWQCYDGLATDSYAVTVGSDGPFTGAVAHGGYVLFFKQTCIHKIYGTMPSNYQVREQAARGVEKGSDRSLVIVDEVLYYKAADGIMGYDGSLPQNVSSALGGKRFRNARAGSQGSRYYISMQDEANAWHLYCLDTASGIWHREDNTQVRWFANCDGEGYLIREDNQLLALRSGSHGTGFDRQKPEADFGWTAETGDLLDELRDNKWVSRIQLRMKLEAGTEVTVKLRLDAGEWETVCRQKAASKRTITLPIAARRCDHLRLRLEGSGPMVLYTLAKMVEQGSEF